MRIRIMAVKRVRTKAECKRLGGVYRKGVRGERRASCAMPSRRSPAAKANANLARFIKRGQSCRVGEDKILVKSRTNPRGTQACISRAGAAKFRSRHR